MKKILKGKCMDIEKIIMYGVIWNAVLQTMWFVWSFSIHKRKHKEDK
jgi:hypothetical protein